jgi:hypothetical protein
VLLQLLESLEPRIGNLAYLLRVEMLPSRPMDVLVESKDTRSRSHVDKSIANIAVVKEIYWEVQVVKTPSVPLVD